jgi:hypothetical protein
MEDVNQPSPERVNLLKCLQAKDGSVPPQFWAACQICDLGALEKFLLFYTNKLWILRVIVTGLSGLAK